MVGKRLRCLATLASGPACVCGFLDPLPDFPPINWRAVGVATSKQTSIDVQRNLPSNMLGIC